MEVVTGTAVANIGERRLPAGVRVSIQHIVRQAITCGPNGTLMPRARCGQNLSDAL